MKHAIFVNKNRITFKDKRAYVCDDAPGKQELYVPSSTTILEYCPKGKGFYDWLKNRGKEADTIMMEAAEKGSKIHAATEVFDLTGKFRIEPSEYTLEEVEQIHRYAEFSNRYLHKKPLAIEWSAGSLKLGYGGTLDRIFEHDGDYYLLDIKTGQMYDYYFRQLASYKALWEQFNPKKKIKNYGILHLNAQTRTEKDWQGHGWRVLWNEKKHEDWLSLFLNTKREFHLQVPNFTPDNRVFDLTITKQTKRKIIKKVAAKIKKIISKRKRK